MNDEHCDSVADERRNPKGGRESVEVEFL